MTEYLGVVSILIAISGFIFQQFGVISGVKERLTALETKMDIFWKAIEGKVVEMLKSYPSYIEKDTLLDKMAKMELNVEEAEKLRTILACEFTAEKQDNGKKIAYTLTLARLEQIIVDIKNSNKIKRI